MSTQPAAASPMTPAPMPGTQPGAPWNASRYKYRSFYVYEQDLTSAGFGAGDSNTASFNIAGDSDFFWTKLCAFCVAAGAFDGAPQVSLLVTNTTSGRQYSSTPVPLSNVSGLGQLPFILPMVTLLEAKSTLQVQLANTSGAISYTLIALSFIGIKAFF